MTVFHDMKKLKRAHSVLEAQARSYTEKTSIPWKSRHGEGNPEKEEAKYQKLRCHARLAVVLGLLRE